jgi:hypothetical protein
MNDLEEMYLDAFFARVDAGELIPIPIGGDGAEQLEQLEEVNQDDAR